MRVEMTKKVSIPEFCLVLLVGPSGSGKSTFGRKHFRPTEVISSDYCRGIVSDDENDQTCTKEAFELLYFIVEKRLKSRKLTVVDATNIKPEDRKGLIQLAKKYHALSAAFIFDLDMNVCIERNKMRPDRMFGAHVVRNHVKALKRGLKRIKTEGIRYQFRLSSPEEVEAIEIDRQKLWTDKREECGPFDIIGDIHGCATELELLLCKLGYIVEVKNKIYSITPPVGRRAIFVGDLVDRGPRTPDVLRIVKNMVEAGTAFCVAGNHENKLVRALNGRNVKINHGLGESLEQLDSETPEFKEEMRVFMDGLISHYVMDMGKLVVAHAGISEDMQGRSSGAVRSFCLYGETTGESDEFGLPVRFDWAREYRGQAKVVYGHTPVLDAEWVNGTICIDTGCVFGGKLSALMYPEMELVEVAALEVYCEPLRPIIEEVKDNSGDTRLFLDDVTGKRVISVEHGRPINISAEHSAAALEIMSRFAIDPRWLIHLPPTMSPVETSKADGYLERPEEAFKYYKKEGVEKIVCEEKHMGSRALIVACRNKEIAAKRFGISDGSIGSVYTRTGRAFFNQKPEELEVLDRTVMAAVKSGLFEKLDSDWLLIDAEIMPWSVKAQSLIEQQYAPVGIAAETALSDASSVIAQAMARSINLGDLQAKTLARAEAVSKYRTAYHPYVWPVESMADIRIAPFHILASEKAVHRDKDHQWHMNMCHELASTGDNIFFPTKYRVVDLNNAKECAEAIAWWQDMTNAGSEGMVVKPFDFTHRAKKSGIVQPAVKVRGKEYLRIIYGPDYDLPENLERLRSRGLGKKRGMAMKEFSLGMESLHRFINREPLRRVHECVMGVLAMESEPIDPRL